MKRIILTLTLLASFTIAQVPGTMSFQGMLTHEDGSVYDDGGYSLTFRLIKIDDDDEEVIWEETHNTNLSGGVFSVVLGSVNELPDNIPSDALLETELEGIVLEPRQPLTSVPFALRSNSSQFSQHSAMSDTAMFSHQSHHAVLADTAMHSMSSPLADTANFAHDAGNSQFSDTSGFSHLSNHAEHTDSSGLADNAQHAV